MGKLATADWKVEELSTEQSWEGICQRLQQTLRFTIQQGNGTECIPKAMMEGFRWKHLHKLEWPSQNPVWIPIHYQWWDLQIALHPIWLSFGWKFHRKEIQKSCSCMIQCSGAGGLNMNIEFLHYTVSLSFHLTVRHNTLYCSTMWHKKSERQQHKVCTCNVTIYVKVQDFVRHQRVID